MPRLENGPSFFPQSSTNKAFASFSSFFFGVAYQRSDHRRCLYLVHVDA
jgi:hypothetical protein